MKRQSRLKTLLRLKIYESYKSGMSLQAISEKYQISLKTAHRQIEVIQEEVYKNLANISKLVPVEYAMSIALHRTVMHEALEIAHSDKHDSRTKLEALRVVLSTRQYLDQLLDAAGNVEAIVKGDNNSNDNKPLIPPIGVGGKPSISTKSDDNKKGSGKEGDYSKRRDQRSA